MTFQKQVFIIIKSIYYILTWNEECRQLKWMNYKWKWQITENTRAFWWDLLFDNTSCVLHPYPVPFLENEMTYSLRNPVNTHPIQGECSVLNDPNLKMKDKKPQLCPFGGLYCPFLVIPRDALFSRISSEYHEIIVSL